MFKFFPQTQTDESAPNNYNTRHSPYRMSGLRHNPYVGSFHNVKLTTEEGGVQEKLSKNNPLVGVFRHSPSASSILLGPRKLSTGKSIASPVISQLQISKQKQVSPVLSSLTAETVQRNSAPRRDFLTSWKQIPLAKYDSSVASQESGNNPVVGASPSYVSERSDSVPVCSICLVPYVDGDKIKTLTCSHCFHSDCVGKWFFQISCLDHEAEGESHFNCPECRQDHFRQQKKAAAAAAATAAGVVVTASAFDENDACAATVSGTVDGASEQGTMASCTNDIAHNSFLSVGNYLLENTFDFLSDVDGAAGSSLHSGESEVVERSVDFREQCTRRVPSPIVLNNCQAFSMSQGVREVDPTDVGAVSLQMTDLAVSLLLLDGPTTNPTNITTTSISRNSGTSAPLSDMGHEQSSSALSESFHLVNEGL